MSMRKRNDRVTDRTSASESNPRSPSEAIALADRVIVLRAGRICRTLAVERPVDPREREAYGAQARASLLGELGRG